jgi:hypothetical protein
VRLENKKESGEINVRRFPFYFLQAAFILRPLLRPPKHRARTRS